MLKLKDWRSPMGLSSLLILLSIVVVAVTLKHGATNLISNASQQEQTKQPIAAQESIDKIDTSETYD